MNVIHEPSVCIWWIIANTNVQLAYHCKNIFRLLCWENILQMNLGRYKGFPREERLCPLCKLEQEDESLFLWVCPIFAEDRNNVLSVISKYFNLIKFCDMDYTKRTFLLLGGCDYMQEDTELKFLCDLATPLGCDLATPLGVMLNKRHKLHSDNYTSHI